MLVKFIITIAAFYHVMASLAAMMAVFQFTRILRGEESHHPLWRHVFDWGETHLWISGLALVSAGLFATGWEYLDNPKLWTKLGLIALWAANSYAIKKTLKTASNRRRNAMLGVSIGSLLYGTLLGVAKPLAYGVLSFPYFLAGLALTIGLCTCCATRLFTPPAAHA